MKKILIFVASGFSTRMGVHPKALAKIGQSRVILNAINNAEKYYDDIFIICNSILVNKFVYVLTYSRCDVNTAQRYEIFPKGQ